MPNPAAADDAAAGVLKPSGVVPCPSYRERIPPTTDTVTSNTD